MCPISSHPWCWAPADPAPGAPQAALAPDLQALSWARVQQAFLPKFENEGQDSLCAAAIVGGAGSRYMVVTIKHSGSLLTLSAHGFAAKNSIQNDFTAGGVSSRRATGCACRQTWSGSR